MARTASGWAPAGQPSPASAAASARVAAANREVARWITGRGVAAVQCTSAPSNRSWAVCTVWAITRYRRPIGRGAGAARSVNAPTRSAVGATVADPADIHCE
jgi:hypothetical protein